MSRTLHRRAQRWSVAWGVAVALLCGVTLSAARAQEARQAAPVSASSAPLPWTPLDLPRALVVRGLWSDTFRWQQALHHAGIDYDTAYVTRSAYHRPNANIRNWPEAQTDLLAHYSTLVLINVGADALHPARLAQIKRFVEQGGGLVVLGGSWAFAKGGYADTPLAEILPCVMPPERRIPSRTALSLAPGNAAPWDSTLDFTAAPMAFYIHHIEPKAGADIWLRAGDAPAIIAAARGRGRSVAVALTAHGEPIGDQTPFWDWPDWPRLLGRTIAWAGANRPLAGIATAPDTALARDIDQLIFEPGRLTSDLLDRMLAHPSPAAAEALLTVMASPAGPEFKWTQPAVALMTRYARPEWFTQLAPHAESIPPAGAYAEALLHVLGATGHPEAGPILLRQLRPGPLYAAAVHAVGRLGAPSHRPRVEQIYREAWQACESEVVPGKVDPERFGRQEGDLLAQAALARWRLGDPAALPDMLALHREALFLRDVFSNAGKRRVVQLQTTAGRTAAFERERIQEKAQALAQMVEDLRRSAGPIPTSQQAQFISFAKQAAEPLDVHWCLAALRAHHRAGKPFPWSDLGNSHDGLIRAAARSFATPAHD